MLKRYLIHIALIFLFAFAQIGVAAHEISHLSGNDQHSQQTSSKSKNTIAEQCAQCLSYAKVANGLISKAITLAAIHFELEADGTYFSNFTSSPLRAYGARSPPLTTSI